MQHCHHSVQMAESQVVAPTGEAAMPPGCTGNTHKPYHSWLGWNGSSWNHPATAWKPQEVMNQLLGLVDSTQCPQLRKVKRHCSFQPNYKGNMGHTTCKSGREKSNMLCVLTVPALFLFKCSWCLQPRATAVALCLPPRPQTVLLHVEDLAAVTSQHYAVVLSWNTLWMQELTLSGHRGTYLSLQARRALAPKQP